MPEEIFRQANFTGGELDPRCIGRRDLKSYARSLAIMQDHLPMPQGPALRRPGLAHVDLVRNRLEAVPLGTATFTAPNGGDATSLKLGTGMTTDAGLEATNGYVIAEIDFGSPVEVGLVDLVDFGFAPGDGGGGGDEGGIRPAPPGFPWWKRDPDEVAVLP
jgi:hypothetical protein